jgi:hypothetical protein
VDAVTVAQSVVVQRLATDAVPRHRRTVEGRPRTLPATDATRMRAMAKMWKYACSYCVI